MRVEAVGGYKNYGVMTKKFYAQFYSNDTMILSF
jgi:hypothetical protein